MSFRLGDRIKPNDDVSVRVAGRSNIGTVVRITDEGKYLRIKWDKPLMEGYWATIASEPKVCNMYSSRVLKIFTSKASKYDNVCYKIKTMEAKRKEQGYAF